MTERDATRPPMNGEAAPDGAVGTAEAPPAAETPDYAAVVAERDSYLDQLQRSRADYANLRRRTEQERGAIREVANAALIRELLPVLDDLQDGLASVPENERTGGFYNGVDLVEQKFRAILERLGVTPIEAAGQPFDPTLHDAVDMDPAGGATVAAVYRRGYRLGQNVLRPAAVKVGPAGDAGRRTPDARS